MTKILIDLQSCQNASRFRGLGRYARNMAQEIAGLGNGDDIHILLNGAFPHTILDIKQRFAALLPDENIHVVEMLSQADETSPQRRWRKSASELLREAYVEMLAPDVVFCPSFIEGYGDDLAVSLHRLSSVPVAVGMHDLIPLILREQYLSPVPDYERFYMAKIAELASADGLVAISEQSFREAVDLLKYDPAKAINASEGVEPVFRQMDFSEGQKDEIRRRFGLKKRFVFYTGGADSRKNLERLISAYAALPLDVRGDLQLVFAGSISEVETARLQHHGYNRGLGNDEFRLLGFVSDQELAEIYNLCTVFVFPSLHEGFGLPCLEAMQCGAATIGSNLSSLPEVLGTPEAQFDPRSEAAITAKMQHLLTDEAARLSLIEKGKAQAQRFSWTESAKKASAFLQKIARPAPEPRSWQETWTGLQDIETRLLAAIVALPRTDKTSAASDMAEVAQAIAANRVAIEKRLRPLSLPVQPKWRIEGPFDSSYSLALVNRELALALDREGAVASLFASEGPGDYAPDEQFLKDNPEIARLHQRSLGQGHFDADVVSRNMYPPRVLDMSAPLNGLNCYAWEETGFPFDYAEAFNESLQFITVTSAHVKKLLIDAGVDIPIAVVGNGIDHWLSVEADPSYRVDTAGQVFLHVSSCFPRKGVDVLLESYGRAFSAQDDVLLIIKTFPNPHNTVAAQLAQLQQANPDYPPVKLINEDLSESQLKALYQQCHTLVAPSRAEGFGLPLAEAMLSGLSVITTGWSGQLDFCTPDSAALIDFAFARADTHQDGKPASTWAEPDPDHLAQLLRAARDKSATRPDASALLERFSWRAVAQRTLAAVQNLSVRKLIAQPRVGWVTTYRKRCGIATYSEHLLDVLGLPALILANTDETAEKADPDMLVRCWNEGKVDDMARVMATIERQALDTIVIQFNYGFFDFASLSGFIDALCDADKRVVVTLHATKDPAHDPSRKLADLVPCLSRCDRLLVHSVTDMNRLKALGLVDNVALFPHGVLVPPQARAGGAARRGALRLASYGFFLPNKGLLELIEAARLLKAEGFSFHLDLVNAVYPAEVSRNLVEEAERRIAKYGLRHEVRLITDFLSDSDSLAYLAKADIVVYPYQDTGESASGAVRYGLAAGKPVAVTPLGIFEDVADSTFALPGTSPEDLAEGLKSLAAALRDNAPEAQQVLHRAETWRNAHAYPVLGRRLAGMLRGLYRDRLDA